MGIRSIMAAYEETDTIRGLKSAYYDVAIEKF